LGTVAQSSSKAEAQRDPSFGPVRCPTEGCREVFFEIQQEFWLSVLERFLCAQCGKRTFPTFSSLVEGRPDVLYVQFWCNDCKKNFTQPIAGIRKYCRGCKVYHHIFLHCLLVMPVFQPVQQQNPLDVPTNLKG